MTVRANLNVKLQLCGQMECRRGAALRSVFLTLNVVFGPPVQPTCPTILILNSSIWLCVCVSPEAAAQTLINCRSPKTTCLKRHNVELWGVSFMGRSACDWKSSNSGHSLCIVGNRGIGTRDGAMAGGTFLELGLKRLWAAISNRVCLCVCKNCRFVFF